MKRFAIVLMLIASCLMSGCWFPLDFNWSRNLNTQRSIIRGISDAGVTTFLNGRADQFDVEFSRGQIIEATTELLKTLDTGFMSFGAFRNKVMELFPDEMAPIGVTILSVLEHTPLPVDTFGDNNLARLRAVLKQAKLAAEVYKWEHRDV